MCVCVCVLSVWNKPLDSLIHSISLTHSTTLLKAPIHVSNITHMRRYWTYRFVYFDPICYTTL